MDQRTRGYDLLKMPLDDDDDDAILDWEKDREDDDNDENDNSLAKYFRSNEDSVKPSAEEYEVNTDAEDIFRVTLTTKDREKLGRYNYNDDDDEDLQEGDDALEVVYNFGENDNAVKTVDSGDIRNSFGDEQNPEKKGWMQPASLLIQDDEDQEEELILPPSYNKIVADEKAIKKHEEEKPVDPAFFQNNYWRLPDQEVSLEEEE